MQNLSRPGENPAYQANFNQAGGGGYPSLTTVMQAWPEFGSAALMSGGKDPGI
jgi:hypothetical protein